ncbi:MAG: hypothetical protein GF307_09925 [candidate division Zixibacteria bacterium]|nr:hypothetical protein [candidate division Zixibacteria bacterium]
MKVVVYERYDPPDILEYKEIEKPVPEPDEALAKVHAASLNAHDWRMLRAEPFLSA